jgi:hypothetical protein
MVDVASYARRATFVLWCVMAPVAAWAQIVVPDVKRWSEKECSWMYQQVLPECRTQRPCSATPDFSMSTERGLTSLDAILTVRNRQQFDGICLRVCQENTSPRYAQFKTEFCSKIKGRFPAPRRKSFAPDLEGPRGRASEAR